MQLSKAAVRRGSRSDIPLSENSTTQRKKSRSSVDVYDDGYLRVEHENYYVECCGKSIALPRTEFLVLSRLVRTPGRIVTTEELWEYVWGDKPVKAESLHVYIYRLRNKFADCKLSIDTMVNVGYRLVLKNSTSQ
ncbi:MAG TPA: helix-turn-helix domain-containing protein [Pyrinomonadaceae bacterium]|nr:helix-turn-helix domain-containing protein [Pyrinomonadaceae bacterium]